jgi:hypothetical protein
MTTNGRPTKQPSDHPRDIGFFNWHVCRQEIERLMEEHKKEI